MRSLGSGTTNVGHVHAWYKVTDCFLFAFSLFCFPLLFPQFRTQATGIPSFSLRELRPRVSKTVFTAEASASTPLSDSSTLRYGTCYWSSLQKTSKLDSTGVLAYSWYASLAQGLARSGMPYRAAVVAAPTPKLWPDNCQRDPRWPTLCAHDQMLAIFLGAEY